MFFLNPFVWPHPGHQVLPFGPENGPRSLALKLFWVVRILLCIVSFGVTGETTGQREGTRQYVTCPNRQYVAQVVKQYVAVHLCAHKKTASLLSLSPPGCHQLAPDALAQRRFTAWSGRRGSNPRQPAWKAVCCMITARLLPIGSASASSTHSRSIRTADIVCCPQY